MIMKTHLVYLAALGVTILPALCQGEPPKKALAAINADDLPFVQAIEVVGKDPQVIYVPIQHDGPMNHVAANKLDDLARLLGECEQIAAYLYEKQGVRNILLEGCGKKVGDYYAKLEGTDRQISFAHTKMKTFEAWGNILNAHRWKLAQTTSKPSYGPLTVLGSEYDRRIQKALATAQKNGWFRSRKVFVENQEPFNKLVSEAAAGYNEKRAAILKEDPRLTREYDINVTRRNEEFIDNILSKDGPGIIMCGAGHIHALKAQFEKRGLSYMVIVPKTLKWPVNKKTEEEIFEDMLKQGCKLKSCNLRFGDGTGAKVKIPVD